MGNLEADVNPGVWTNIEQGLQTPASVTGHAVASKSAGILGKIGLKSLLMITAASITVIGTIVYFATGKTEPEKAVTSALLSSKEPASSPSISSNSETIVSSPVEKETKNSRAEKQLVAESNKVHVVPVNKSDDSQGKPVQKEQTSLPSSAPVNSTPKTSAEQEKPAAMEKAKAAPEKSADASEGKNSVKSNTDSQTENTKLQKDPVFDTIEKYLVADARGKNELPNSFSPNGDGKNDVFKLETIELRSLEVIVFDLNGKQVYSWNSLNGGWDGTLSNAKEAPEGNYFYSVNAQTAEGKICIAKNSLRLFRNSQN